MVTKKALIVDDSRLAQFVLKNMLVQHEFEVDSAESAEEALGYLSNQKPDVIFLDHTMPGMDGLQALKAIKDNPDTNTIPVLMYTSQSDDTYLSQAKALGAVDILPKQLKPVELEKVLEKLQLVGDQPVVQQPITRQEAQHSVTDEQATKTSEIEELSKLLREAEAALEKETLKQFVQQELEKQHRRFTVILQKISHGLNELTYTKANLKAETKSPPTTPQMGRLLWPLLFVAAILVFGLLYFQMQQSLSSLQQLYVNNDGATVATNDAGTGGQSSPLSNQLSTSQPSTNQPSTKRSNKYKINKLLKGLEKALNVNSTVSFEEPLLGEHSMQKVAAIIAPLNTANFSGQMQVIAHTGNFCLGSGAASKFISPATDTPISQCQIVEPATTIENMMTAEFRNFIANINNDEDNRFYITVSSRGGSQPLANYPVINADTTAGEWNSIAQQNRRVEIILNDER